MKKFLFKMVVAISFLLISKSIYATNLYDKELQADSALMINLEYDQIVVEKNIHKRRSPASLTKIMTFIVTSEKIKNPETEYITISKDIFDKMQKDEPESSISNLKDGDRLSVLELLYCMMVASGNDAAMVLANYIGQGSIENFVDLMNQKALDIGCNNTHFTNPHGLYNENHYSTAMDMYLMSRYAMDLPHFKEIVSTVEYDVFKDSRPKLVNTNKLINPNSGEKYYYKYAKGIKTGQHNQAGRCLASYAKRDFLSYICIILGTPKKNNLGEKIEENLAIIETKNLYTWAFNELSLTPLTNSRNPINEIKLNLAWKKDKLLLYPEKDTSVFLPKNFDKNEIRLSFNLPKSICATIKKNQIIGNVDFFYKDTFLSNTNLVSRDDVKKSIIMVIINFLFSIPFLVSIGTLTLIILLYVLATLNKNLRKKNLKKSSKKITHS